MMIYFGIDWIILKLGFDNFGALQLIVIGSLLLADLGKSL
jgi:hypothetical protein